MILEQVRIHGFRGGEDGQLPALCLPKNGATSIPATPTPRAGSGTRRMNSHRAAGGEQVSSSLTAGRPISRWSPPGRFGGDQRGRRYSGRAQAVTIGFHFRTPEGADPAGAARQYLWRWRPDDRAPGAPGLQRRCDTAFRRRAQDTITGVKEGWSLQTATVITAAPLRPSRVAAGVVPRPRPMRHAQLRRPFHSGAPIRQR